MNSEQEQELSVCVRANGSEHVYCMSDGGKLGWPWGGQHAFFVSTAGPWGAELLLAVLLKM